MATFYATLLSLGEKNIREGWSQKAKGVRSLKKVVTRGEKRGGHNFKTQGFLRDQGVTTSR